MLRRRQLLTGILTAAFVFALFVAHLNTSSPARAAGITVDNTGDIEVCPAVDQRGPARPQGAHCDSGAFEVVGAPIPPLETATLARTPTIHLVEETPARTPPSSLAGDVNCDGHVNSIDATLILQFSAGLIKPIRCIATASDVNGDRRVDSLDAALVLQYDAGLIHSLPV
jgi:hypothetical protein